MKIEYKIIYSKLNKKFIVIKAEINPDIKDDNITILGEFNSKKLAQNYKGYLICLNEDKQGYA